MPSEAKAARKVPAWLIPAAIAAGFAIHFGAIFPDRLLPATDVEVGIVLATAGDESTAPAAGAGRMLFQASGWIEPDPYAVKATSLVDGVVETVAVLEGQKVEKGDLLATLIDADARLALSVAEQKHRTLESARAAHVASISSAEKRLDAARGEVLAAGTLKEEAADKSTRYDSLHKDAISRTEVIAARLRLSRETTMEQVLEAGVGEQEAELRRLELETRVKDDEIAAAAIEVEQAKLALERTKIFSPVSGRILRLNAAPGQKRMLASDDMESSTIAVIYDPEKLQVRVDVPLADAAGLQVGQAAKIRCSLFPDRVFEGEVTRITGEADLQRNTLQAKVRVIDPDDALRPEMLCRVEFLGTATTGGGSATLATWVPDSAISNGHVWAVDPESNRVEKRPVEPSGETRDGFTRVTAGVRPGDRVVLSPGDLREGGRVDPQPSE